MDTHPAQQIRCIGATPMSEIRAPWGDNHPNMSATDLLRHILAHLPNLDGARCVAECSTFANVRRT